MSNEENVYKIVFRAEDGTRYEAEACAGTTLLAAARDAGAAIDAPCGGGGTCGKCRVKLISGELEAIRGRHISEADFAAGFRLACESAVRGDAEIEIPESALAWQSRIRVEETDGADAQGKIARIAADFTAAGFVPDKDVRCVRIDLDAPSLDDAEADRERLLRAAAAALGDAGFAGGAAALGDAGFAGGAAALGGAGFAGECDTEIAMTLNALRKLPALLRDHDFSVYCLIAEIRNGSPADLPGPGSRRYAIIDIGAEPIRPVGLAVDIGTTTVSALLVDIETGEALAAGSAGNGQIRYGADVINRLIEGARPGGAERLRKAVIDECLAPLTRSVCAQAGLDASSVAKVSITGNTTMVHLLLGVHGNNIRMEPYVPAFFTPDGLRGADLAIGANPDAAVCIAPSVGSYVGGDITAGVLASGIHRSAARSILIDLGTNGEIVLSGDGFLMACACSAGPAFEGGDMSCGMRATDGAVWAVGIDEETMAPALEVIGGISPRGICGTGLIDLIGELFRCRIIDARGKFIREGERIKTDEWEGKYFVVSDGVVITETDIDNFIRAKGSVFSAIRTMLELTGMEATDIEQVSIAGGIGNAIDVGSAVRIGMLPALPEEQYAYVGNTSLSGAYQALMSSDARAQLAEIQGGMTYIELSAHPGYMDEFIAACFLPHTDASLFE
ncbi:MAG: ASKHA domain-containing protein [Clostridiales Family XIII bacterium]|jgi:uncharacterized 2Fe-2S/4Fe-4S cluster protein (DUF4445 family)|nr:ASKHA domain-containing protein [Clostridiales Family XIII bacterium]